MSDTTNKEASETKLQIVLTPGPRFTALIQKVQEHYAPAFRNPVVVVSWILYCGVNGAAKHVGYTGELPTTIWD